MKKPRAKTPAERQQSWRERHPEEYRERQRVLMRERRAKERKKGGKK